MTGYGRRDPLAATRRANTRERMARRREGMSAQDVESVMAGIIRGKLELQEPVSLDDFRRANLPMDKVEPRFQRVLASLQGGQP